MSPDRPAVVRVRGLTLGFGGPPVLHGVDLDLFRGEVLGLVGASGSGKSVLTRAMLGLLPKSSGSIEVLGREVEFQECASMENAERRIGVLFQFGALISSLSVKENVQLPMREHLDLPAPLLDEVAMLKLDMVGLSASAADKLPSELSGGMIKRAALARALALDPEILFLDEPTSGLDPIGAGEFDELITTLRDTLGLSVFMVTHDLDSLATICDRIAAIVAGRIVETGSFEEMLASEHPWVKAYFRGKRSRAALENSRLATSAP